MSEAAVSVLLHDPSALQLVFSWLSDEDSVQSLRAAACVCKAWKAPVEGDDGPWKAALLRRWPSTPAVLKPAPLPTGAALRSLFKRRGSFQWVNAPGSSAASSLAFSDTSFELVLTRGERVVFSAAFSVGKSRASPFANAVGTVFECLPETLDVAACAPLPPDGHNLRASLVAVRRCRSLTGSGDNELARLKRRAEVAVCDIHTEDAEHQGRVLLVAGAPPVWSDFEFFGQDGYGSDLPAGERLRRVPAHVYRRGAAGWNCDAVLQRHGVRAPFFAGRKQLPGWRKSLVCIGEGRQEMGEQRLLPLRVKRSAVTEVRILGKQKRGQTMKYTAQPCHNRSLLHNNECIHPLVVTSGRRISLRPARADERDRPQRRQRQARGAAQVPAGLLGVAHREVGENCRRLRPQGEGLIHRGSHRIRRSRLRAQSSPVQEHQPAGRRAAFVAWPLHPALNRVCFEHPHERIVEHGLLQP